MFGDVLDIQYIGSYETVKHCPALSLPEYCFIGRSNVGKSSIINYITGKNEIARTSKKPGKTQTINLFKILENPEWMIADLPGYGYAQVSKSTRGLWSSLINGYVLTRANLMCVFLLLDIRHPRQENDRQFMSQLGKHKIPFCILYTKSDKLKPDELKTAIKIYENEILTEWEELPPSIITSSVRKVGREQVLEYIYRMNAIFAKQAF